MRQSFSIAFASYSTNKAVNNRALVNAVSAVVNNNRVNITIESVMDSRRRLEAIAFSRRLAAAISVTYGIATTPYVAGFKNDSDAFTLIKSTLNSGNYGSGSAFLASLSSDASSCFAIINASSISAPVVATSYSIIILKSATPTGQPTSQPSGHGKVVIQYLPTTDIITIIASVLGSFGVTLFVWAAVIFNRYKNMKVDPMDKSIKEISMSTKVTPDLEVGAEESDAVHYVLGEAVMHGHAAGEGKQGDKSEESSDTMSKISSVLSDSAESTSDSDSVNSSLLSMSSGEEVREAEKTKRLSAHHSHHSRHSPRSHSRHSNHHKHKKSLTFPDLG